MSLRRFNAKNDIQVEEKWETADKPGSVIVPRGTGTIIPLGLASPQGSSSLPGRRAGRALYCAREQQHVLPYLALLRVGFSLPLPLPEARCALTAPFHPYRRSCDQRRYIFCGTFRRLAPPSR